MSKQPRALSLGASSGFGEATALELARAGMNIFGVHLDRRDKLPCDRSIADRSAVRNNVTTCGPNDRACSSRW